LSEIKIRKTLDVVNRILQQTSHKKLTYHAAKAGGNSMYWFPSLYKEIQHFCILLLFCYINTLLYFTSIIYNSEHTEAFYGILEDALDTARHQENIKIIVSDLNANLIQTFKLQELSEDTDSESAVSESAVSESARSRDWTNMLSKKSSIVHQRSPISSKTSCNFRIFIQI